MKILKTVRSLVSFTIISAISCVIAFGLGFLYIKATNDANGAVSIALFGTIFIALILGAFDD